MVYNLGIKNKKNYSLGDSRGRPVAGGRQAGVEDRPCEDVELARVGGKGGRNHTGACGARSCEQKSESERRGGRGGRTLVINLTLRWCLLPENFTIVPCCCLAKAAVYIYCIVLCQKKSLFDFFISSKTCFAEAAVCS